MARIDHRRRKLLGSLASITAISGCQFGRSGDSTGTPPSTASPAEVETVAVTWETGPAVPERRTQTTAVALQGRLHVIGGIVGDVERRMAVFDPEEGRWEERPPPPKPVNHTSAVAYDGRIHVFGGYSGSFLSSDPLGAHWVYDPAEESWSTAASLPTAREHLAAGVLDGKLYAAGGRQGLADMFDELACYDPAQDGWTTRAPMPTARAGIAGDVLGGYLFVFGGEQVGRRVFEAVEAYDPTTDSWTAVTPLPTPRWGIGAATVGRAIHTVCGGAVPGGQETRTLEMLSLDR